MLTCLLILFAQDLKVPAEVKGLPGQFITIVADTPGEVVKFAAIDPGLSVFPAELLATRKATVVTGPAGKYRVFAYTAVAGKLSDPAIITVVIGDGSPVPPQPGPGPKPPEPQPDDALYTDLRSIVGGLQTPTTRQDLSRLAGVYDRAGKLTGITTVGQLFAETRRLSMEAGTTECLPEVKARIAQDINAAIGSMAMAAVDQATYKRVFSHIAGVLNRLAGE